MAATREVSRLKRRYEEEIRPELIRRFGYSSPMQAPVIRKITLNMGVGDAKQDTKALDAATEQLATIAGQRPNVRRARKSVAAFKLREGMPVGLTVTLRGERGYEFLDRLMSIAIPRIRDFRGMNPRSFDGRGNYSLGVREQIIFPEIEYDSIDQTRGMDITITTSANTDAEAFALLEALGFPFQRDASASAAAWRAAEEQAATEAEAVPAEEGEPDAEAVPAAEGEPEAETVPAEEGEPEAEASEPSEEEPEAAAPLELETDGDDEAVVETEVEPEAVAETEAQSDTESEPQDAVEAEPEALEEPQAQVGSVTEAEPETVERAEPETVAEPEASLEGTAEAAPTEDEE